MDLLAFERKLDQTIMRKRLDIQEALKRPIKVHADYLPTLFWIYLGHVLPFRRTKLWLSFLHLCARTIFDWKVSLNICLLCAAKKKTTDIYLQHLQSCQTRRRGRRGYRCILGAACGGTTSWRRKWGFQVNLFIDFRLFLKALNVFPSSSDCCVKVWSHQAEEEVFFFLQVFSDWVG